MVLKQLSFTLLSIHNCLQK